MLSDKYQSLFISHSIQHQVNGENISFHAVPMGAFVPLRKALADLLSALTVLFGDTSRDAGMVMRDVASPINESLGGETNFRDTEQIFDAVTPELIQLRSRDRDAAIQAVADALTNDATLAALGHFLLWSLEGKRPEGTSEDHATFAKEIPAHALTPLLIGAFKANKGILGPMAEQASKTVANLSNTLKAKATAKAERAAASKLA